ncbi:hypothetical protein Avbf_04966 [Armadillidium vulgare]|nr:hypothetical protein Avbf_04966 [Armadillidium vulgare]
MRIHFPVERFWYSTVYYDHSLELHICTVFTSCDYCALCHKFRNVKGAVSLCCCIILLTSVIIIGFSLVFLLVSSHILPMLPAKLHSGAQIRVLQSNSVDMR